MHFFLLIIFIFISFVLISLIIFQCSSGSNLSSNVSDYSSQLFTEHSKSYVMTYTIIVLLILFFIMSLMLCKFNYWAQYSLNI
ncbi:Protein-export membrane protein SecG [Buchnera aphidicola (Cinara piceae)]|uniref:Protein-export membrane protein SecG n=1 Tax=Buchnera aphidicola (Cinara piceae) TaxID=1660043 RepID=A0A803FU23_9GAMM|nr:preprotein translocase subunit SecG [Buchnera aphidicola]VFP88450.1 Protein-export membrane protein SecG [Buchnera aphidicola (Cinara piceae)]